MKPYTIIKNTSDKEIKVLAISDRSIITDESAVIAFVPDGVTKGFAGIVTTDKMLVDIPAGSEAHVFMIDKLPESYKEPRDIVALKGYFSDYTCYRYLSLNPELGEQSYCLALTRSENAEAFVSVIGMNRYTKEVQIKQVNLDKDNIIDVLTLTGVTNIFVIRHNTNSVYLKARSSM